MRLSSSQQHIGATRLNLKSIRGNSLSMATSSKGATSLAGPPRLECGLQGVIKQHRLSIPAGLGSGRPSSYTTFSAKGFHYKEGRSDGPLGASCNKSPVLCECDRLLTIELWWPNSLSGPSPFTRRAENPRPYAGPMLVHTSGRRLIIDAYLRFQGGLTGPAEWKRGLGWQSERYRGCGVSVSHQQPLMRWESG